jgi:hypothetical protein
VRLRSWLLALPCFAVVAWATPARAGDFDAAASGGVATSAGNGWSGDGLIPTSAVRLAYRFPIGIAPVAFAREGYARVDERLLTLLGLGAQGWLMLGDFRPFARLAWIHQHEEPVAFAKEEPFGILFGVGRGIRHRGGVETALGFDYVFAQSNRAVRWFATLEGFADWTFAGDAPAPSRYFGSTLGLGLDWTL